MICPKCDGKTKVKDARYRNMSNSGDMFRRRWCVDEDNCGYRFTTREIIYEQDGDYESKLPQRSEDRWKNNKGIVISDKLYYTGELCVNGHDANRYRSTGICVECQKIYNMRHYLKMERMDDETMD